MPQQIQILCPTCKSTMRSSVEITDGCMGHGDGSFCYCPYPDVIIVMVCTKDNNEKKIKYCTQKAITIIPDKYSLERFFNAYYTNQHRKEFQI